MRGNILTLGLFAALGACSNSGATQPTSSAAPWTTAVTDAPVSVRGAVDPCAIVTTDDVEAAFGGAVAPGVLDPGTSGLSALPGCEYAITGQTKTGDSGTLTQASIGLTGEYISYDEMKAA
jgi:hypothetical protein